ncbi:hypothetical protein Bpfe_009237, partial [Biomphalaria pfeifferi]
MKSLVIAVAGNRGHFSQNLIIKIKFIISVRIFVCVHFLYLLVKCPCVEGSRCNYDPGVGGSRQSDSDYRLDDAPSVRVIRWDVAIMDHLRVLA